MTTVTRDDWGKLVLRLTLGALLLFHGVTKLKTGVDWLEAPLAAHGLPAMLKDGVYFGEVVAPLLILFGVWSRLGGLLVMGNLAFAFLPVHRDDFFTIAGSGGWQLELQVFFFLTGFVILIFGAGKIALMRSPSFWN